MTSYSPEWYETVRGGALSSAEEVVPIVTDLLHPASVVDVGCGGGSWLATFREHGVDDVLGIDGEWVSQETLSIPEESFLRRDLRHPLSLSRRFDLVVSLEVAEHLPAEAAGTFIDNLCSLGDVILFSAAIPGQGGANHVNERWPDHWAGLFRERDFSLFDPIRPLLWDNPRLEYWYAQNTLVFVRSDQVDRFPELGRSCPPTTMLNLVHPRMHLEMVRRFFSLARAYQKVSVEQRERQGSRDSAG